MRATINPLIEKIRGSAKPIVVAVIGPAAAARTPGVAAVFRDVSAQIEQ
ncbi:MAG: hypothetical protein V4517_25690 [Pseudomonadota bacterium]